MFGCNLITSNLVVIVLMTKVIVMLGCNGLEMDMLFDQCYLT
jgi:hypothetical protein